MAACAERNMAPPGELADAVEGEVSADRSVQVCPASVPGAATLGGAAAAGSLHQSWSSGCRSSQLVRAPRAAAPREHLGARLPYRLARLGSAEEAAALAAAAVAQAEEEEVRRRRPGLMARIRSKSSDGALSLLALILSPTAEAKTEEEEVRRRLPGLIARRRSNSPDGFVASLLALAASLLPLGLPLMAAVKAVAGRARKGLESREGG